MSGNPSFGLPQSLARILDGITPPSLRGNPEPRVRVLVACFAVSIVIGCGFSGYRLSTGVPIVMLLPLGGAGFGGLVCLVALWLFPRQVSRVGAAYFGLMSLILPGHVAFGDGTGAFAMAAVASVPICTLYVLGLEAGLVVAITVTVAVSSLAIASRFGFTLPPIRHERDTVTLSALATMCALWLPYFVAWSYEKGRLVSLQALERSEARATLALRAANGGVLEMVAGEPTCFVSPRLAELLGLEEAGAEPMHRERLFAALEPADARRLEACVSRALQLREPFRMETRTRAETSPWLAWEAIVGADEAGVPRVVAIVRGVTEEHRVAAMKQDFVSTISHELRTPLATIHGSVGLLNAGVGGPLTPTAAELALLAGRGSIRLLELVNDLLDVQRLDQGELRLDRRPIDISRLVERVREACLAAAAERGVTVQVSVAHPEPGEIVSDPRRVEQVVHHLVTNACKFTRSGTRVEVRVSALGSGVRIDVLDQGSGVPESFRPHLFERFSQAWSGTARPLGGTGLGLNIARSFAEQLGGRMGYEAREGRGSTFWVEFPTLADARAAG